jgi:hypothetical protein
MWLSQRKAQRNFLLKSFVTRSWSGKLTTKPAIKWCNSFVSVRGFLRHTHSVCVFAVFCAAARFGSSRVVFVLHVHGIQVFGIFNWNSATFSSEFALPALHGHCNICLRTRAEHCAFAWGANSCARLLECSVHWVCALSDRCSLQLEIRLTFGSLLERFSCLAFGQFMCYWTKQMAISFIDPVGIIIIIVRWLRRPRPTALSFFLGWLELAAVCQELDQLIQ